MISVCIATYNGQKYIKEQLESILPQLSAIDEIIVSDDQSIDNTISIIKSLKDERIKIYIHDKKAHNFILDYPTSNFENAILHSSGDVIFLSDQDDVWLDNKVKESLSLLENCDIVISGYYEVDEYLNKTGVVYFSKPGFIKNTISNTNSGCCIAFKRHILNKILPFPKRGVGHDYWIAVFGGLFYKVEYLNKPLMLYRRHGGNVTPSGEKSNVPMSVKIKYRVNEIFECVKRYIMINIRKSHE